MDRGEIIMSEAEIKETIEYIEFKVRCGMFLEKHSKVIKTLAEQYLAVQAKMPRWKEYIRKEVVERILPKHIQPTHLLTWADAIEKKQGYKNSQLTFTLRYIAQTIHKAIVGGEG